MSKNLEIAYTVSRRIYKKDLLKKEAIEILSEQTNFKINSIKIMVGVLPKLYNGESFSFTLRSEHFLYFLKKVAQESEISELESALLGLKAHIEYRQLKGKNPIKLKKLFNEFSLYLEVLSSEQMNDYYNIQKQDEIIDYLKKTKSKTELLEELKNYIPQNEPERIEINHRIYIRDNKIIAIIKILRDFKCQICGGYILKKNGNKYIEAAHITPKSLKGNESPENIILLCPNHHKEFDLGDKRILSRDKSHVKFKLNDIEYYADL